MAVELGERASVPVRCVCGWDDGGTLELVDRWKTDWPPIPYVRMIELHGDSDADGRAQMECGACGEELSEETVEERS